MLNFGHGQILKIYNIFIIRVLLLMVFVILASGHHAGLVAVAVVIDFC